MSEPARPPNHVCPRKQNGNMHRPAGWVFSMPAVNRDWIAGLAIVLGEDGRELFENHMRGKFVPAIVIPGLRIKRIVITRSDRVIPLPTRQRAALRMVARKNLGHAF